MKTAFLVLIVLSIIAIASSVNFEVISESVDEIVISISLDSYTQSVINGVDGSQYICLEIESDLRTYLETYPSYPYICKFILSPPGSNVSLDLDNLNWVYEGNVELPAVEEIFEEDFYYPIESGETPFWKPGVFLGETDNSGSFGITPIFIFPFQYNRSNNELFSLNECVFSINITPGSNFTIDSRYADDLEALCFNYETIERKMNILDSGLGDYLVIYSHEDLGKPQAPPANLTEYKDALMPLMDYRESQGYNIRWAYVSPEATSAEVKNVIDCYMQIFDITNIILLGQHTRVPLWTFNYGSEEIHSDTRYIEEYGRFGPIIGRFPGSPAKIGFAVSKILEYEEYFSGVRRPQRLFVNEMVLMAHEDSPFKGYCEAIMDGLFGYGTDLGFITYFREDGPIAGEDIRNTINSGVGMITYLGHAERSGYSWNVPEFYHYDDMLNLENNYHPVVLNLTCATGRHFQNACQAEGWLHNPDGGASGVLAATGNTYNPSNYITGLNIFHQLFWISYSHPQLIASKVYYVLFKVTDIHPGWASDINLYRYTWFGDPGQRLWTEESIQSKNSTASFGSDADLDLSDNVMLENIESISIGSNPSYSSVYIEVSAHESSQIDISVYDISGRKIDTIHTGEVSEGNNSFTWDNEIFPQGLYMIRLTDNTGASKVERVMILK
ncbi:MAG: T9SS type A sorting domain-containing protein [Candidatus Aegiribacteria sp.]|nr:T9SS type A sorting domain-containing protein [Candidatus Aegiribacteria sp.]